MVEVDWAVHRYLSMIIGPALILGILAVKLEHKIFAFATSVIGGMMFSCGFSFIFLARLDGKYVEWMHPCMFKRDLEVGAENVYMSSVACHTFVH